MDKRTCAKCHIEKAIEEFSRSRREKSGRQSRCKACKSADYRANREEALSRQAEYRAKNRGKIATHRAAYKATHREALAAEQARYRNSNPDVWTKWYEANKEARAEYRAAYRRSNRSALNSYNAAYRAENRDRLSGYAHRRRTRQQLAEYDQMVTLAAIRERDGDRCCYCQAALRFCGSRTAPNKANIEHIKPVSRGGAHTFDNTAISCRKCNQSKHAKLFIWEWVP